MKYSSRLEKSTLICSESKPLNPQEYYQVRHTRTYSFKHCIFHWVQDFKNMFRRRTFRKRLLELKNEFLLPRNYFSKVIYSQFTNCTNRFQPKTPKNEWSLQQTLWSNALQETRTEDTFGGPPMADLRVGGSR